MQRFVPLVVVLAFALLIAAKPAAAGETGENLVQSESARAEFTVFSDDGCVQTNVFVTASEQTIHTPPGAPVSSLKHGLSVLIEQWQLCDGEPYYFFAAYGELPEFALDIQGNIQGATVQASLTLYDEVAGYAPVPATVNLTWTGVGEIVETKANDRFPEEDYALRYRPVSRVAEASGTIAFGETTLVLDSASWAELASSRIHESSHRFAMPARR